MTTPNSIYDIVETTVRELVAPSHEERLEISRLPKSFDVHDKKLLSMPSMTHVEVGGEASQHRVLSFPFNVAAWNLERCLFPLETAKKIAALDAAIVLLSEMDDGMARTGQKNTTRELAHYLQMQYAYGVEFIELGLGSEIEHQFCVDSYNAKGFHGNGLMAKAVLNAPFIQRLHGERIWFMNGGDQPRIGERMAIGAVIETEDGPFLAVSVHLESASQEDYRRVQADRLIDALEKRFGNMPILIGGDLNTGNQMDGDFEKEGLFASLKARGFERHSGRIEDMTTRPSLISRFPERAMKLDWFLSRGLKIEKSEVISSLDENGRPLSDHDMIICTVSGFK